MESQRETRRGVEIPRSPSAFTNLPVDLEGQTVEETVSETWESPASLLLYNLQRKGFIFHEFPLFVVVDCKFGRLSSFLNFR